MEYLNMKNNTILITGGSNGIGLAFAKRFLERGNEVIICGRREEKLKKAKEKFPQLHIKRCDMADEKQRIELCEWVTKEFPDLNILINNAGIQRRMRFDKEFSENIYDWGAIKQEIAINLEAPVHLTSLLFKHLSVQNNPCIMNVTSELAFTPPVWVPVYGATKAGMHSFTFSLREQLKDTGIKVIEIIPPAVNTDLGGVGMHTFGVPVDDFADVIFEGLEKGNLEVGFSDLTRTKLTRQDIEKNALEAWKRMR